LQELSGGRDGGAARAAATPELLERARRDVAADLGLALPTVREFDQLRITNVTSRSFGVIALQTENGRQVEKVVNLIQANDQLPAGATQQFGTGEANQANAEIQIAENISHDQIVDPAKCEIIGNAALPLPPGLPAGSPVEINFQLDEQGRLHATARELSTNKIIEVNIETNRAISAEELEAAKSRATRLVIS
jgi:molecular chaperone DnaK